tara:strand:+ start:3062 stop:5041 length:1980 start_codon:yes stop_codon:yes gene_type:complete
MKIPPHSEVALQSCKVNKADTITITGREVFYECFGQDLDVKGNTTEIHRTLMNPIRTNLRSDNTSHETAVSLDEFTERVGDSMNRGLPHPDLIDLLECKQRLDSENKFSGLDLVYTHATEMGDTSNLPALTSISPWNLGITFDEDLPPVSAGDGLVATTDTNGIKVASNSSPSRDINSQIYQQISLFRMNPLSHINGEMRVDIDYVVVDTTDYVVDTPCAFGLVRSNATQQGTNDPPYWVDSTNDLLTNYDAGSYQFYDYVIRIERTKANEVTGDFFLWVGQSAISSELNALDEPEFCMREVEYYDWDTTGAGGSSKSAFDTGRYNMTTNTLKINQFKFQLDGEDMKIWYHTGAIDTNDAGAGDSNNGGAVGTWTILCSMSQSTTTDWEKLNVMDGSKFESFKLHIPKPSGQDTWNMYPMFSTLTETADRGVVLSKWGGHVTSFSKYANEDRDYYLRQLQSQQGLSELKAYQGRNMFVMGGGSTIDPDWSIKPYVRLVTSDWGGDCSFNAILTKSNRFKFSGDANIKLLLGFIQDTLTTSTPPTIVGSVNTYSGSLHPTFSVNNLFIRLNNFSQTSVNGGIGRPSKIIYTMPRFDNAGNESGSGLYFEPAERVYLSLGNTETLYINEFDITMVDNREVLTRTLHGTSVVCLHFRQRKVD